MNSWGVGVGGNKLKRKAFPTLALGNQAAGAGGLMSIP